MTPAERENPDLLNASRKQRIAKGAGVELKEFNMMISQFNDMRNMMSMFSGPKNGKMPNMMDIANKMRNKKIKYR